MAKINAQGQASDVTAEQAEGNVYLDTDVFVPEVEEEQEMAALNPDANPAQRPVSERVVTRDVDEKTEVKPISTPVKATPAKPSK